MRQLRTFIEAAEIAMSTAAYPAGGPADQCVARYGETLTYSQAQGVDGECRQFLFPPAPVVNEQTGRVDHAVRTGAWTMLSDREWTELMRR